MESMSEHGVNCTTLQHFAADTYGENSIQELYAMGYLSPTAMLYEPCPLTYGVVDSPFPHSRRYLDPDKGYRETVLGNELVPRDFDNVANGNSHGENFDVSRSNSLDQSCRAERLLVDLTNPESTKTHDHYMVPTRDPRELNERVLSLFNPQFLPNFNDMVMYVATQCADETRTSMPPRSRSMAESEEPFIFDDEAASARRRQNTTSSMFFRRGLT